MPSFKKSLMVEQFQGNYLNRVRTRKREDLSILSMSFKMTAEIEIRKHKVMFFVLFRGGVVSALYRICSFIAMKCVYIVFYCQ